MVSNEHYNSSSQAVQNEAADKRFETPEPIANHSSMGGVSLPPMNEHLPLQERPAEAMRLAQEAFTQTSNWIEFFREILGVDGIVRKLFKTMEEKQYFEESREHGQIQEMLTALRSQDTGKGDTLEPQRMITVRLPKSLHEYLRVQAEEQNLSINKLCISKLLQVVDDKMVPEERGGRRGRRPGPQGPRKKKDDEVVVNAETAPQTYGSQTPYQSMPQRTTPVTGYQHPPQRPHFG